MLTWSQLLTPNMTPELASIIMGVCPGQAEIELRRAACVASRDGRFAERVALFLQSNFPTEEPRPKAKLI